MARQGDVESLRNLITQGGDINKTGGKLKMTPLIVAAHCDNFHCLSLLLDNGADITAIDNEGCTTLFRFVEAFYIREQQEVISHKGSEQLIHIADRMLRMGANASEMHMCSLVGMAISSGVFDLVKLLVRYGADPSVFCYMPLNGASLIDPPETALAFAITQCNGEKSLKMVKLLIDLGADLSFRTGHQTPLVDAILWEPVRLQNPEDMVRLLLENGVFLSEETTEHGFHMTYEGEYQPIASVESLTAYATRRGRPLCAALIANEPANRERKLKWHKKCRKMRRDAFLPLKLNRIKQASDVAGLTSDSIDIIWNMI